MTEDEIKDFKKGLHSPEMKCAHCELGRKLLDTLARVEALADEPVIPYPAECQCAHGMGFQFHQYPCRYADNVLKAAIRAALRAAPPTEQNNQEET